MPAVSVFVRISIPQVLQGDVWNTLCPGFTFLESMRRSDGREKRSSRTPMVSEGEVCGEHDIQRSCIRKCDKLPIRICIEIL